MIQLKALKPLNGAYGAVSEGAQFGADPRTAQELEARGLASRIHVGVVERMAKAFLGAPENKEQPRVYAPKVLPDPPRIVENTRRKR